jgi:glycosyltransferase involved in cell wall biosynthesis
VNVVIACGILPPEIGGPASAIPDIAAELRDAGHDVAIVTYTASPAAIDGVRLVSVSRAGSVLRRYLRFARALRRISKGSDLVLATDVFSVGVPARLALLGRPPKLVLRLGGEWCWELAVSSGRWSGTLRDYWNRRRGLCLASYRWLLKRASLVITTSDMMKDLLARQFPDSSLPLRTVPNVRQAPLTEVHSRPHAPLRLLYVGRFARVKNVPFLARVLRRLHERGVPVACTFAGDGEELERCRALLTGVPNVTFLGRVGRNDLPELFERHDVYVLPSLSDLCPNGVVEARTHGLPCIVTSENGLPRPLSGVVEVDPFDEDGWADAISRLRDERTYRDLASESQRIEWSGETSWPSILREIRPSDFAGGGSL